MSNIFSKTIKGTLNAMGVAAAVKAVTDLGYIADRERKKEQEELDRKYKEWLKENGPKGIWPSIIVCEANRFVAMKNRRENNVYYRLHPMWKELRDNALDIDIEPLSYMPRNRCGEIVAPPEVLEACLDNLHEAIREYHNKVGEEIKEKIEEIENEIKERESVS